MRDYDAIHLIQKSGLSEKATSAIVRNFNKMCSAQEPDGCLSMSAVNCLALAYLGMKPSVILGQVKIEDNYFYHAWVETDGRVIDVAIYGNTHFSPYVGLLPQVMPQVYKPYSETNVKYFPNKYDNDFNKWNGHIALGMNLKTYLDHAPKKNALWNLALYCLDLSPTAENVRKLKDIASHFTIGEKML